jgi:adenylate cyclase
MAWYGTRRRCNLDRKLLNDLAKMPTTRRLAAVLAADVAGYSRLIGSDERGTLQRLKAIRAELIDPDIAEHNGRIVKTTGDGLLAEFGSTVDALRCAGKMQALMAERNFALALDTRIEFRIGIHQGDIVVEDDGDIFGNGVNIAARLEALAEPGGICVSARVQEDAAGKLDLAFRELGERQLKNIARPVRAFAVGPAAHSWHPRPRPRGRAALVIAATIVAAVIAAVGWAWPRLPTALWSSRGPPLEATEVKPAPRLSIVVLPFANLSTDPDYEYVADAITDDLTTDLSRISDSFVIARTTAFTYKGKAIDVRQVARELAVRYVLEGSVRRQADQVHVNVQLLDGQSGAHVWADRLDIGRRDIVEGEEQITTGLASRLQLEIVHAAARTMDQETGANPEAQDLVLRARALSMRPFSRVHREENLRAWEQALTANPRSTTAQIGVASILVANVGDGFSNSVESDLARSEQLLLEVIQREPNRSWAHQVMGWLRRFQNRPAEAMAEYRTAIVLDPNNVGAVREIGQLLRSTGEPAEAIPYLERSLRLDPRNLGAFAAPNNLGWCHFMLGHLDEAKDFFVKARAANPQAWFVHLGLAAVLGQQGDIAAAKLALAESLKLNPEMNSIVRLRAWAQRGQGAGNPKVEAFSEVVDTGLRRAGFPEE